jgi:hypothetical protein
MALHFKSKNSQELQFQKILFPPLVAILCQHKWIIEVSINTL